MIFEQTGRSPALGETQQADLRAAVQGLPAYSGIELANWTLRQTQEESGQSVRLRALRYQPEPQHLSKLPEPAGLAFKWPKKRLLKADAGKREAFAAAYTALASQAQESREEVFLADEAHFRADAGLRGKWVLKGEPALVDSTSPRYGEKASYYSAVCLETVEVEWMELDGNSTQERRQPFWNSYGRAMGGG